MKISKIITLLALLGLIFSSAALAQSENKEGRHPSYNLIGRDAPAADSPLNPNFITTDESKLSEKGFWRSSYINEQIVGMVVEDIDGDGKNEVVYATLRNVYVGRVQGSALTGLASYAVNPDEHIISVDALNLGGGNGKDIIISAQNDNNWKANARILTFSGTELTERASRLEWFVRVINSPGGKFLAGQKPSTQTNEVFNGSVHRMSFDGTSLKPGAKISLPTNINLYDFSLVELGQSREPFVAGIKFPSEHIILYEGGSKTWESREEYGGTVNFLWPYTSGGGLEGNKNPKVQFIPSRMLCTDIDGDGQNELLVAKNDRGGVPFMHKQRAFNGGTIEAFKYANLALNPIFRTRRLPGAAVDYALVDFNNNGSMDLVAAVLVEPASGMMKGGRSILVAYEISSK